ELHVRRERPRAEVRRGDPAGDDAVARAGRAGIDRPEGRGRAGVPPAGREEELEAAGLARGARNDDAPATPWHAGASSFRRRRMTVVPPGLIDTAGAAHLLPTHAISARLRGVEEHDARRVADGG